MSAKPKITLEFQLKPFKLVRSCLKMPGGEPLRMSNHAERDRAAESDLKWDERTVPKALAAFVFAFVRARRFAAQNKTIDDSWRVLIGGKGSAAFTLGGVYTQTNAGAYKWVQEFSGCVESGDQQKCALNAFIRAPGYKAGSAKEVEVLFDATMFPPENILVKVRCKAASPDATPKQLLKIERTLCGLKVWEVADELAKHIPKTLPDPGASKTVAKTAPSRRPRLDHNAFQAYRAHIARQFGDVQEASLRFLSGVSGNGGDAKPPRLAEVYVKLDTEQQTTIRVREGIEDSKIEKEPGRVPAIKRLISLLNEGGDGPRNLVLLGGPGSGKSTFLKHVSLALAQHALAPRDGWLERLNSKLPTDDPETPVFSWPKEKGDLVPIFVELRKFAHELAQSPPKSTEADCERLWAFIADELAKVTLRESVPALKDAVGGWQRHRLFRRAGRGAHRKPQTLHGEYRRAVCKNLFRHRHRGHVPHRLLRG